MPENDAYVNTASNQPKALVFDHITGEARWVPSANLTVSFPPAPGPLSRAQGWCHRGGRLRGYAGNRISDIRYALWRLCR